MFSLYTITITIWRFFYRRRPLGVVYLEQKGTRRLKEAANKKYVAVGAITLGYIRFHLLPPSRSFSFYSRLSLCPLFSCFFVCVSVGVMAGLFLYILFLTLKCKLSFIPTHTSTLLLRSNKAKCLFLAAAVGECVQNGPATCHGLPLTALEANI